ncbi:hypothetical protein JR316_0003129 [Psilocybe cubensis]|uniref:Uncharacterized protein n=2 Tax=Psilocybe cubensis TaxID=181762 RepID=A0A8H7Y253_PSICU|nr:hypothetical protein JR316_0003129 [Psilocybe cubensis]KAH9483659.1 hypothetical protein JR316_0003129 [Psilocybe cubensis]
MKDGKSYGRFFRAAQFVASYTKHKKLTLDKAGDSDNLEIVTPARQAFKSLTTDLKKWEDSDYTGVRAAGLLRAITSKARKRAGKTNIALDLNTSDDLAKRVRSKVTKAARMHTRKIVPTTIATDLQLKGIKLAKATQSTLYKHIRNEKNSKYTGRRRTVKVLSSITEYMERIWKLKVSPKDIWKATRHKDLSRTTRYFLWMTMHDAYSMIGENWTRTSYNEELREGGVQEMQTRRKPCTTYSLIAPHPDKTQHGN